MATANYVLHLSIIDTRLKYVEPTISKGPVRMGCGVPLFMTRRLNQPKRSPAPFHTTPKTLIHLATSTASAAKYFKVTLTRSTIGLSKDYRAAAKTLGLHRLHQTTYQPISPSSAGLILKLKELVKVENVDSIPTKEELKAAKPDRGFKVVESLL
ncbi:hypothetical protein EC973_008853 [Apophysomyces ossiformis]|uniref:Large ribosomal subunit protein uL30m n=1 Tax=Apophysomyces ossiformis TaxID=679940 RepID=A0A8H7ETT1_9FUNG|nr:hypothetical protein EC973_008853 [Apophysomyces ossiformis]